MFRQDPEQLCNYSHCTTYGKIINSCYYDRDNEAYILSEIEYEHHKRYTTTLKRVQYLSLDEQFITISCEILFEII